MINAGLYLTYALIAICVLAILIFAVTRIAAQPAQAKSALLGIGGLIVIGVLGYALSSGSDATTVYKDLNITEGTSRGVGAGLVVLYITIGLTILAILYAELTRLFK